MDWTLYWFMFPVSICVATTAMLSGIGGAALFTPIFLLVFPLLGSQYALTSAAAAVGIALLTETFGFSSGFIGYSRRRLIDFHTARPFILVGVPFAIVGALTTKLVDPVSFKIAYATLMMGLATMLIGHREVAQRETTEGGQLRPDPDARVSRGLRNITDRDGNHYVFGTPRHGSGAVATGVGAYLTGMVSVGIGESVMPQLVKRHRVPLPVAAATSVFVVIVVAASAAFTQIASQIAAGGWQAVPWNLVVYTVPGVLIGGQLGPWLQGRLRPQLMIRAYGWLFLIIGIATGWLVLA